MREQAKRTRHARFLDEMEVVVPWVELLALLKPYYHHAKTGRPPYGCTRT